MTDNLQDPHRNGTVLVAAGALAGVIGGVASKLNDARKRPDQPAPEPTTAPEKKPVVADVSSRAREQASSVISSVGERAEELAASARTTIAHELQATQKAVAPKAKDVIAQASEVAAQAVAAGREHAPDIKALVVENVAPRLQAAREQAAQRVSGVTANVEHLGEQVSESAKGSAKDLGQRFAESLTEAEKSFDHLRESATGSIAQLGKNVPLVPQPKSSSKKGRGLKFLVAGAVGAAVIAGVTNPELRNRVVGRVKSFAHETSELIKDIRGRDGDFPPPVSGASA